MTFAYVMSVLIGIGGALSLWFFRRGGKYNPIEPVSDPVEPPKPAQDASSVPTPSTPPLNPKATLKTLCEGIRDFEGVPGDLNYQLNNPGDCRPSPVGYLAKYRPVEIIDTNTDPRYPYHKGKFAKFPTYQIGWEYLMNLVHFMAASHPNWTLTDFVNHYAPSTDGNPVKKYATFLQNRLGVDNVWTLGNLR